MNYLHRDLVREGSAASPIIILESDSAPSASKPDIVVIGRCQADVLLADMSVQVDLGHLRMSLSHVKILIACHRRPSRPGAFRPLDARGK